ncbi:MAG: AAA family ATPase [Ignavibacteria bacterium]|jgi:RecA-family ATPase
MSLVKEIKDRINITELVTQLGLMPDRYGFIKSIYKEESHPSLKLYPDTNSFYDFSSGKGGDVINFFADYKQLDNGDAIRILAEKLKIDNGNSKKLNNGKNMGDKIKLEVCDFNKCIEIYHSLEQYCNGVDDKSLEYLCGSERGLTEDIIKRFRLFSINDINGTIDHLFNIFNLEELKEAGLFNEKGAFVFTKHRLIIPYLDDDKIVYLRGRILPGYMNDSARKYIGLWGHSAKRIFNTNILRNLKDSAELLLCEGEFDTIMAEQKGMTAVGAPGVHNYPVEKSELLRRFNLYMCFDNDEPGRTGMQEITNKIGKDTIGLFLQKYKDLTEHYTNNDNSNLFSDEYIDIKSIQAQRILKSKLKLITAREIQKLKVPEMHWVVKDLLPEGLGVLAGAPKIGKSWMALGIALSIAEGNKALGYFETNKSSVVYIALEDNLRRIKDRMHNILGIEPNYEAPENLIYLEESHNFPKLNENGIDELQNLIDDNPDIKLVIIDTLGRAKADKKRMDNNIYQADYELGSKLQEFTMKNRICVLVIHHTKKGSEENVFDEISGTTGLTGAMDSMMVLKKKNNECKLYITGRDVEESEYTVKFDKTICCWNVVEKNSEMNITAEREEILELIKSYNREMRTGEIAELVGKEKSNVSKLLKKLVRDGLLISPKYGYYALPEEKKDDNEALFTKTG